MSIISIEQAFQRQMCTKKGAIEEARNFTTTYCRHFQEQESEAEAQGFKIQKYSAPTKGLPQENINQLVKLYNQRMLEVIDQANLLIEQDPWAFIV